MIRFTRGREAQLLFEPLEAGVGARQLPVLDFHRSHEGSAREPAQGTIRLRLDDDDDREWSKRLGGAWRVHHRDRIRLMHLNGPLATWRVDGAEVQTWRWEDATA
jgi:hypothetical protein